MGKQILAGRGADPLVPDWQALTLPDAWPDSFDFRKPHHLFSFLKQVLSRARRRVNIPDGMPGADLIPKYVLQEFHNLPNGNYSKKLTRGYITGFDCVMLGLIGRVRNDVAAWMKGMESAVDIGCGGGHMAGALKKAGVSDVWGVDPSPYLLQHAARDYPEVKFVQAIAEDTGFPDNRFDGVAVCFLLHELPPRYLDQSLQEFRRILKPGGLLAISEPSALQMKNSWGRLWRDWGWSGIYFWALARFVHEPFVAAWHRQDIIAKLNASGFEVVSDRDTVPIRQILAKKIGR